MRLQHAIPAGLLDAAFASLATLGVGVYAANALSSSEFGAYALFFSGFAFAGGIPTQLLLAPAEFAAIAASAVEAERLSLVRQTWRLGTPAAAIAAAVVPAAAWLSAEAPVHVLRALAVTTAACSVVSPLQDHVRRLLHLGGVSWGAALVSLVQFGGVIGALALLAGLGVPAIWRPLGALALANAVSLASGLALAHRRLQEPGVPRYPVRRLLRSGRWLLLQEMGVTGASFLAAVIVTRLASPEALGHAEAARIVAMPLFVLTAGLNLVLGPRSVEAGAAGRRETAEQITRSFITLLVAGGLVYGLVTAGPWGGNLLAALLPQAYALSGLVPVTVVAYLLLGFPFPLRAELIGAGRERLLPRVAMVAGALQCVAACGALWIGAFARPAGVAIFGIVASLGYRGYRRTTYLDDSNVPHEATRRDL